MLLLEPYPLETYGIFKDNRKESEEKVLITTEKGDKLSIKDGWITCPVCKRNHRLMRTRSDTVGRNIVAYCRTCRSEVVLNIDKGQSEKRQSQ